MDNVLAKIQDLIGHELSELEQLIHQNTCSASTIANDVCKHLMSGSGKRIRPTILILSALATSHNPDKDKMHLDLACIIEFIHNASLLHDDVIDQASERHHKNTARKIWGNKASILTGDYLHACAFQMIASLESPLVMNVLSNAVRNVVEGELDQLKFIRNPKVSKTQYLNIISAKTARLFSVSTKLGSMISNNHTPYTEALEAYGHHLGMVFQIIDDSLDYQLLKTGKKPGQDLTSGTITLPFILAYENSSLQQQQALEALIQQPESKLEDALSIIEKTHAITKSFDEAKAAASLAQESLYLIPDSPYRQALDELLTFSLERTH